MTVKSLKPYEKTAIATAFTLHGTSISTLAVVYDRSRRTIIRVLKEKNIDPGIKTRVHRKKSVTIPVVIPTYTPWYRRVMNSVVDFVRSNGLGA